MRTTLREIPHKIELILDNLDNDIPCNIEGKIDYKTSHLGIYRIDSQYCLKLFSPFKIEQAKCECYTLSKLQGKNYVPTLYAYNESKYILIEWIDGYSILDYVKTFNELPMNLLDNIYLTEIDMLKCGVDYIDKKYGEHIIWVKDNPSKFKFIDYGVCDNYYREDLINRLVNLKFDEYNNIKNKNTNFLDDFTDTLYKLGLSYEHIDMYLQTL